MCQAKPGKRCRQHLINSYHTAGAEYKKAHAEKLNGEIDPVKFDRIRLNYHIARSRVLLDGQDAQAVKDCDTQRMAAVDDVVRRKEIADGRNMEQFSPGFDERMNAYAELHDAYVSCYIVANASTAPEDVKAQAASKMRSLSMKIESVRTGIDGMLQAEALHRNWQAHMSESRNFAESSPEAPPRVRLSVIHSSL